MKQLAMSLVVAVSSASALAQTPKKAPASTLGTTTAPIAEVKKSAAKQWSVTALTDMSASEKDVRSNRGDAKFESLNQVAVSYSVTESTKVGVLQEFSYNHLTASTAQNKLGNDVNRIEMIAPAVRVSTKTSGIFGSKDLAPSLRYYIPVSYERRSASGYYGSFRGDIQPEWELSTKTSLSLYLSPRATFAPQDNVWTDSKGGFNYVAPNVRLIAGPDISYAFNDSFGVNAYSFMDQVFDYNNAMNFSVKRVMSSGDKQDFKTERSLLRNDFYIGAGLSWTKKFGSDTSAVAVKVNPYLEKKAGLSESYENPSQNFEEFLSHHDNLSYNLYLSVSL